ncbi:hypothetical protein GCM10022222_43910 [Amycolatopsis ultiminotia]|uniref:Transmembrane protein n=1 Tax=Amycolatopsis ultiminotia TaxID=543629 RepID=A0ABP6WS75_9PSEU
MFLQPPPDPTRTARIVVCLFGGLLTLAAGWLSLLLLGFSAMCTDDGDPGDCAGVVALSASPIGAVLPTAVAAMVLVFRTRRPAVAWGGGLGLLAVGVLVTALVFGVAH